MPTPLLVGLATLTVLLLIRFIVGKENVRRPYLFIGMLAGALVHCAYSQNFWEFFRVAGSGLLIGYIACYLLAKKLGKSW